MQTFRPGHILAACPLAFCAWLAYAGRTASDTFQIPCYSQEENAHALAYKPLLKQADHLFERRAAAPRATVLTIAQEWDQRVRAGSLLPLTPASYEDSVTEGPRGRIVQLKSSLVAYLMQDAKELAESKDVKDATDEVLLAMRLSESLKYSDFSTVASSGMEQRAQMELLRHWRPSMDSTSRNRVRKQLARIAARRSEIKTLIVSSRTQYYDWIARTGGTVEPHDVRVSGSLMARVEKGQSNREILCEMAQQSRQQQDLYKLLAGLRLAWLSEARTSSGLRSVRAEFSRSA